MNIKEALELFKHNCTNKISIVMMNDDGKEIEQLKPTLYQDIKYRDIKDFLNYEVYSIYIDNEYDKPCFLYRRFKRV